MVGPLHHRVGFPSSSASACLPILVTEAHFTTVLNKRNTVECFTTGRQARGRFDSIEIERIIDGFHRFLKTVETGTFLGLSSVKSVQSVDRSSPIFSGGMDV
jgi:hypothetical protein